MNKTSKKTEPKAAEKEPEKKLDTSFVASLRRIAKAFRAVPAWDNSNAAKALEHEADLLDPSSEN